MKRTFDMIKFMAHTKKWMVLDNHYSEETSKWLLDNVETYGYVLHNNGYNMGLHDGYNYILTFVDTTHVIGLDPDVLPASFHFDLELMKHTKDPRNVWISCFNTHSFGEMRNPIFEGELIIPQNPVVNSICCWDVQWLRSVGGLQEPNKLYGGLECEMWKYVDQVHKRWVFALNSLESGSQTAPNLQDECYIKFKWEHAFEHADESWEEFRKKHFDSRFLLA